MMLSSIILALLLFLVVLVEQHIKSTDALTVPSIRKSEASKCSSSTTLLFSSSVEDLEKMTVPDLKQLLKDNNFHTKERGLLTRLKRKQDLIDYLNANLPASSLNEDDNDDDDIIDEEEEAVEHNERQEISAEEDNEEDSEEEEENNELKVDNNKNRSSNNGVSFDGWRHDQWKKKRYNMMKDVAKLIYEGSRTAPMKAEQLVDHMIDLYEKSNQSEMYKPTIQAYNLWINAIAKCQQPTSSSQQQQRYNRGEQAQRILNDLPYDIRPNIITYTSVIDAHARSNTKNSAEQAERILFELIERSVVDDSLQITSQVCDAVLNAWARQSSVEAAQRAQSILERMEHLSNENIKPTAISYSTVINAWANSRSKRVGAERAEEILEKMLLLSSRQNSNNNNNMLKPDTVVFNTVIKAWATSYFPQSGMKAASLLEKMKDLSTKGYDTKPDIISYNTVLSCWSSSNHIDAAKECEQIVKDMQQKQDGDNKKKKKDDSMVVLPNTISYNCIINALSKSTNPKSAERAQDILRYMIRESAKDKSKGEISPDIVTFSSVLNAVAKSKIPGKAMIAREILDELLNLYKKTKDTERKASLKPSNIPFNSVLNACAFSADGSTPAQQREEFEIALSTFKQLCNLDEGFDVGPDEITYGNMLKCCSNLMPKGDSRNQISTQIFQKCVDEGYVGELPWQEIRRAVPPNVVEEMMAKSENNQAARLLRTNRYIGSIEAQDLPNYWKRNTMKSKQLHADKQEEEEEWRKKKPKPTEPQTISITESSWTSSQM